MDQRQIEAALSQFTGFRLLGRGSHGAVYEVYDPALGRRVALKTCWHDPKDEDPGRMRDRFYREFDLLARARTCDYIVSVYRRDATPAPDGRAIILWYTMERCEESVAKTLKRQPLEVRARIASQLVNAVAHLAAQGIAHRDIKPQNIFLVQAPPSGPTSVKLGDFGIARSTVQGDRLAQTLTAQGTVHGTAWYLPPEAFIDSVRDPIRGDQYAAAVVVYELLSRGALPFGEPPSSFGALIHAKTSGRYVPLSIPEHPGDLEPIDRVLQRMLNPRPEQRYRHMSQAERALASALLLCDLPIEGPSGREGR